MRVRKIMRLRNVVTVVILAISAAITILATVRELDRLSRTRRDISSTQLAGPWTVESTELLRDELYRRSDGVADQPGRPCDSRCVLLVVRADCVSCDEAVLMWSTDVVPSGRIQLIAVGRWHMPQADQQKVLLIEEPTRYTIRTGITNVPTAILLDPARSVLAMITGVPSKSTINKANRWLRGENGIQQWIERGTTVPLNPAQIASVTNR